jgi:hypothetical protein
VSHAEETRVAIARVRGLMTSSRPSQLATGHGDPIRSAQADAAEQTDDRRRWSGRWACVRTCTQRSLNACLCSFRRISSHRISSHPFHRFPRAAADDPLRSAPVVSPTFGPTHSPAEPVAVHIERRTSLHPPTHSTTSARFELHVTPTRTSTRRHDRSLARASAVVGWTRAMVDTRRTIPPHDSALIISHVSLCTASPPCTRLPLLTHQHHEPPHHTQC